MLCQLSRRRAALLLIFIILFCTAAPFVRASDRQNSLLLTAEERDYITSRKSLKVGYVQDRIPVSFSDQKGELQGISRYIFDHISEMCGLKFEYVPLPTGDVTYEYLLTNKFDLVTSVEYNEANKKAKGILISNPYLSTRKVIVARKNLDFRYDAHLSVAISTGSQTLKKVLKDMYPNFKLIDYDSISDCFDAVNSGKADLMIQNQYVVEYWISKPTYENLKVIPLLGLEDNLCFSAVVAFGEYEGASQEEGQLLIDILDKAIASMNEDEIGSYTIQAVMENPYSFTLSDFLYRYRYAAGLLIVSFVVILILAVLLFKQRVLFAENRADAKVKSHFLSTMSHEIRTPLNGLIGLNYLMSQKLDNRKQMEEYLRQSTVTAKYLLSLVNDILDMSKLQAEKMELVLQPIELEPMLQTINSIVYNAMTDKGLIYESRFSLPWPCVLGDEVRIQQVLLNLLDNARKFTPEGGRIELALEQTMTAEHKVLTRITVSDTGRGISEEFQKHIFDVFAQELDSVSKGNQGTGLGLAISHRLALLMGGDLTLVSQKDNGSTFTFTFLADLADPPQKTAEISRQPAAPLKPLPRILIAEDNELNGEILLDLLDENGFEAVLAENGKKAVERFAASAPGTFSVILMDLLMPEMNGFEAASAIRALDRPDAKTVRIIACTANAFAGERDRAMDSGMDDFLTKPVNIKELLQKIGMQTS